MEKVGVSGYGVIFRYNLRGYEGFGHCYRRRYRDIPRCFTASISRQRNGYFSFIVFRFLFSGFQFKDTTISYIQRLFSPPCTADIDLVFIFFAVGGRLAGFGHGGRGEDATDIPDSSLLAGWGNTKDVDRCLEGSLVGTTDTGSIRWLSSFLELPLE